MADQLPTIAHVKALQERLDLKDVHVIYTDQFGFVIAHTDEERDTIDLSTCALHLWLSLNGPIDVEPGYYKVHIDPPDGYSTNYRSDPYEFEQILDA